MSCFAVTIYLMIFLCGWQNKEERRSLFKKFVSDSLCLSIRFLAAILNYCVLLATNLLPLRVELTYSNTTCVHVVVKRWIITALK